MGARSLGDWELGSGWQVRVCAGMEAEEEESEETVESLEAKLEEFRAIPR